MRLISVRNADNDMSKHKYQHTVPQFIATVKYHRMLYGLPVVTVEDCDVVCAFQDREIVHKGRITLLSPGLAEELATTIRQKLNMNETHQGKDRPTD
jgi:hypothetical protein